MDALDRLEHGSCPAVGRGFSGGSRRSAEGSPERHSHLLPQQGAAEVPGLRGDGSQKVLGEEQHGA
eukprot:12212123-Alexandrium_andersonii.AAC.1